MKKLDICKIKRHFGDKISIFILSYADKVLKRVRTCAFSGGYFPLVMDFEQILRNDGKVNRWGGGGGLQPVWARYVYRFSFW